MKRILIFSIILILSLLQVNGQNSFQIKGKDNSSPLVGAIATVKSLTDSHVKHIIADRTGTCVTNLKTPFILQVKHIGYSVLHDTIRNNEQTVYLIPSASTLDEVVITGQYQPQSAKNSVYKVRTIGADRIAAQSANSIQDVLSNELNIQFSRDNATGSSGISLQGLSGQYVKILLDGVPMSGRSGVSNEIDLGQIDVQSIQRIEIVEGPMSVNYGADALAGVINIITKKDIATKLDLNVSLSEETVGKEFGFVDEGIHSPSIKLGYKLTDHWYTQFNARIYRFGGWAGSSEGRQKDWYPKTQYFGGFLTRYTTNKFTVHYRLDYLDETLENLGALNNNNPLKDAFAIDEEYKAERWMHQVQSDWEIGKATLNSVFSYTDYERRTSQFSKNLVTDDETSTIDSEQDTVFYRSIFFRETLNNAISGEWGSMQVGFEGTKEIAGGSTLSTGDKQITDISLFISSEFIIGDLKVRPGVRVTYNSVFETTPTPSINFNYTLTKNTQLRWSYGRGFRTPSIRELYHEFIDANHNIIGSDALKPEYSHSLNIGVSHELKSLSIAVNASGFYNTIDNRITFFFPEAVNQPTTYINQLKYKTLGGNLRGSYKKNDLTIDAGFSYIGLYQRLSEGNEVPSFVFAPELNFRIQNEFKNAFGLKPSLFYKFTGANRNYQLDLDGEPQLNKINGFHFLDATVSKSFKQGISISLGSRNILDVTSVNSSLSGGAHSGGNAQRAISYGRSYFLRINYNLKQ